MPQITAQLNYLRISPRKVRAVARLLRGLEVDSALAELRYLVRRPAKPLSKLLDSAISNARQAGLDKNFLYIKEIRVDEGAKLKRFKPKGFGLAMPIQKKTSHIKIVLEELPEPQRIRKEERLAKMPKPIEIEKKTKRQEIKEKEKKEKSRIKVEKPKLKKEPEKEKTPGKERFGGIKTLGRRLFRRKAL